MARAPTPPAAAPDAARTIPVRGRRAALVVTLSALAALVVGLVARPVPDRLPDAATGDAELAHLAREVVGTDRPALAVAAVMGDDVRTAVMGASPDARFEIGSISKGLTGLLFEDMIRRGEVTPGTRVGALLPLRGPIATVTLEQLATHGPACPPSRPPCGSSPSASGVP